MSVVHTGVSKTVPGWSLVREMFDRVVLPGLQTSPVILTSTPSPVELIAEVQFLVTEISGLQVLNASRAKSFRVAVNDWEERVCGRNELIQPVNPAFARSIPTS